MALYCFIVMSNLRERKKTALRATIVRAAVKLFVERGYDAVNVEEIAYASMCSRSTFNRYFGTKEDVLFPDVPDLIAGLQEEFDNTSPTVDRWAIARVAVTAQLERVFETFEPDLRIPIMRLWFDEPAPRRRYLEIAYQWEQALKSYFAAGLPDDVDAHLHVQVLASSMVSAMRAVLHAAIESDGTVGDLADSAFGMIEKGISPSTSAPRKKAVGR